MILLIIGSVLLTSDTSLYADVVVSET